MRERESLQKMQTEKFKKVLIKNNIDKPIKCYHTIFIKNIFKARNFNEKSGIVLHVYNSNVWFKRRQLNSHVRF